MTPRDREIVRWIGRHRMVTAAQVAERFQVGRSQCYARLTGLVRLGLLTHERLLYGRPGVYLATRRGLDLTDVDLPPANVDLRTYEHDLQLVSLVRELEEESTGSVMTERELRSIDTPAGQQAGRFQPRYAVLLGRGPQLALTPAGSPRVHFPDAVLIEDGSRPTAIELERTLKGRTRFRGILRAYVGARHLGSIRYYVPDDASRAVVSEEVGNLRAEALIEVRAWPRELAALTA